MREDPPDGNGYAIVLGKPDFSMCVGLHTHSTNTSEPCNETRTGLDHGSFGVAQRAALDTWAEHFEKRNVCQSPINHQEGYAVLVFRDPDNIQLELISISAPRATNPPRPATTPSGLPDWPTLGKSPRTRFRVGS